MKNLSNDILEKNVILNGNIARGLIKISIPLIATSLFSIFYSLIDSYFVSKFIGDKAVSGVAGAIFAIMFGAALMNLTSVGAQSLVAQSVGRKDLESVQKYSRIAVRASLTLGLIYSIIILFFSDVFLSLIGIKDTEIFSYSNNYLKVSLIAYPFWYSLSTMSSIVNGTGKTKIPFLINSFGLSLNIILDYIFIVVFDFGVEGISAATVISQMASSVIIFVYIKSQKDLFYGFIIFKKDKFSMLIDIFKIGAPSFINRILFTSISMAIASKISELNEIALGVQRIGIGFEAFSWNISLGVSNALATYVGQNYGAKKYDRIKKSYSYALSFIIMLGSLISIIFIFFGENLYSLYYDNPETIILGKDYIKILGYSQIFMCMEILTVGGFNGLGRTLPPSIVSFVFTFMRIPGAYLLSEIIGLDGVWWSISMSSVFKGVILVAYFLYTLKLVTNDYYSSSEIVSEAL